MDQQLFLHLESLGDGRLAQDCFVPERCLSEKVLLSSESSLGCVEDLGVLMSTQLERAHLHPVTIEPSHASEECSNTTQVAYKLLRIFLDEPECNNVFVSVRVSDMYVWKFGVALAHACS